MICGPKLGVATMVRYGMVWYGMAFPEQLPSQLRLTCPMLSTNDGRQVHLGKKRPTHTMVLLVNKCMMLW